MHPLPPPKRFCGRAVEMEALQRCRRKGGVVCKPRCMGCGPEGIALRVRVEALFSKELDALREEDDDAAFQRRYTELWNSYYETSFAIGSTPAPSITSP